MEQMRGLTRELMVGVRRQLRHRSVLLFIGALIVVDVLILGAGVLNYAGEQDYLSGSLVDRFRPIQWDLTIDRGVGENWLDLKLLLSAVILLALDFVRRERILMTWAAIFLLLVVDDRMQIHERFGGQLAESLSLPDLFGFPAKHFGELVALGILGLGVLAALVLSWSGSSDRARAGGVAIGLSFGVLAGFGVFIDILPNAAPRWNGMFAVIEDGGEVLASSLIVFATFVALGLAQSRPLLDLTAEETRASVSAAN